MSLTDSNKKKNYSNVTNSNTKVAKIDKKTTLDSVLSGSGKKSTGLIRPEKGKPFKIKEILLNKKNIIPFKKK